MKWCYLWLLASSLVVLLFFSSFVSFSFAGLIYSSYLGGSADDYGHGIALDGSGNTYIAGITYSTNFPQRLAFLIL
jgi:hypothetical protein